MDKQILTLNRAGRRFIAQTTIYNGGDAERLRVFIRDSYDDALLAAESVEERLAAFRRAYDEHGRLRVRQVIATDEYQIIVLMQTEKDEAYFLNQMTVQDDYPHKVTQFSQTAVG